jgi:hypothetical protein
MGINWTPKVVATRIRQTKRAAKLTTGSLRRITPCRREKRIVIPVKAAKKGSASRKKTLPPSLKSSISSCSITNTVDSFSKNILCKLNMLRDHPTVSQY